MANFCNCSTGLSNTGSKCPSLQAVTTKLIYVPLYGNDGVRNSILTTDLVDKVYVDAKINETDKSKRWYPSPRIENVEDTKGDSVMESLNSGDEVFVQEGTRTFMGVHIKQDSTFLGKIKNARCVEFGVYLVDSNGIAWGEISEDGTELYPIAVNEESYDAILVRTTDTTSQKVQVKFSFSRDVRDESIKGVTGYNMNNAKGLLDVNGAVTVPTTVGFTYTATLDYGYFGDPLKVEGLVIGDFTLYNNTTVSAVVITSVTEVEDGVYAFVIPAQTASDELVLTGSATGFEFSPITFTV